jgi:hypothetical protein
VSATAVLIRQAASRTDEAGAGSVSHSTRAATHLPGAGEYDPMPPPRGREYDLMPPPRGREYDLMPPPRHRYPG